MLLIKFGDDGIFAISQIMALTNEEQKTVLRKLENWLNEGLIVAVCNDLYVFREQIDKNRVCAEYIANRICQTSYVSGLWRMNQLGLIPEGPTEITNATRRNPVRYDTPLGRFSYQHLPRNAYFGFEVISDGRIKFKVGIAEKAVLDFFWWKAIEWNEREFCRWRIQDPFLKLNLIRLKEFADRWGEPKLIRAAENLSQYLSK